MKGFPYTSFSEPHTRMNPPSGQSFPNYQLRLKHMPLALLRPEILLVVARPRFPVASPGM